MNLEELKNKTLLLFGKPRAFSLQEFDAQMKHHKITLVDELNDAVIISVDGRMMTPYEQLESDALYEKGGIASMNIDALETQLALEIDEDTLLMSLKLSHDKERLKSFIQNSMITNSLFFRLMKMYNWNGEDFFENDDNRDVSAAFIARFYENIERNHNVQYATSGFIHLVAQAKNAELLNAISLLEPLQFHPKIKTAIAMSAECNASMQKRFFKSGDTTVLEALSVNENLLPELVQEFMKSEEYAQNIARTLKLTKDFFSELQNFGEALAYNVTLDETMQETLLKDATKMVKLALASNHALSVKSRAILLDLDDEKINQAIYENKATPHELLEKAYEDEKYHSSLAKNENTPVEILYQLQLDSRYERYVRTNAGFGKHIQSENIGWMV